MAAAPMPAAASNLRRLSSRLNSVSGMVIAARLLHRFGDSLSQLDDSPANPPQTDPVVLVAGHFGRGCTLTAGAVRQGSAPGWVKLGQNGHPDQRPRRRIGEIDTGGQTS
jgi:hypothetical protein